MGRRIALAVALMFCGCVFSLGSETPDTANAMVGPAGGSLSMAAGPRLDIPAGALSASTRVSIVKSGAVPPARALSSLYMFKPEDTAFAQPATVMFPLPQGASDAVIYWSVAGNAAEYEMLAAQVENGMAKAKISHLGSGYAGVRPGATRTVSGGLSTIYWQDDGTRTPGKGVLPPAMQVSAIFSPNGSGYDHIPISAAADTSFSVPDVPEGRYLLQVDTRYPPTTYQGEAIFSQLIELTTSTPDLSTVVAARPDIQVSTLPTPVTIDISNLTPWVAPANDFTGDMLLLAGSQSHVFSRPRTPANPAAFATSAHYVFDWTLVTSAWRSGLPDASRGDVEYIYQRSTSQVGTREAAGVVHSASRIQRLDALTVRDGVPASLSVNLSDMPQTGTLRADLRGSQFAALGSQVNPAAQSSTLNSGASVLAVPHSIQFPDQPGSGATSSVLWVQPPATVDANYGIVSYGQLPAPLWKEMRYSAYGFDVNLAIPGASSPYQWIGILLSLLPADSATPIAPVLGPPRSPRIEGRDAFVSQTGVGTTPTFSWSSPSLGSATSYTLRIDLASVNVPPPGLQEVSIALYSGTSVKVPAGFLKAGQPYVATISAVSAPWDTLDRPPFRTGTPLHMSDCVTAVFTP